MSQAQLARASILSSRASDGEGGKCPATARFRVQQAKEPRFEAV